jgi:hypothetical protein
MSKHPTFTHEPTDDGAGRVTLRDGAREVTLYGLDAETAIARWNYVTERFGRDSFEARGYIINRINKEILEMVRN